MSEAKKNRWLGGYIGTFKLYTFKLLTHKDSNLNWLNQNQKCYHYTMGQYH